MAIGKRIWDLARSNLSDFRQTFRGGPDAFDGLSEEERQALDEELKKETVGAKAGRGARRVRDAAEDAWERAYESAKARAGVRGEPPSDPAADRRRWYKTLELQPGADLKTVRRSYRKLLLQYHPDKFANDPAKQKVATEVTRRLTEAYNGLTRYLGG